MLIEFDGFQHFETGFIYKHINQKTLEITQKHDKIKNEYCKNGNIKLLRIPYWKFNDIEKVLKEFIYYSL